MNINFVASCKLPTPFGVFTMHGFEEAETGKEHIALTMGTLDDGEPVLLRAHSECLTGDALFSMRCDCGYQLEEALRSVSEAGRASSLVLAPTCEITACASQCWSIWVLPPFA